jgi:hypothetical protein
MGDFVLYKKPCFFKIKDKAHIDGGDKKPVPPDCPCAEG